MAVYLLSAFTNAFLRTNATCAFLDCRRTYFFRFFMCSYCCLLCCVSYLVGMVLFPKLQSFLCSHLSSIVTGKTQQKLKLICIDFKIDFLFDMSFIFKDNQPYQNGYKLKFRSGQIVTKINNRGKKNARGKAVNWMHEAILGVQFWLSLQYLNQFICLVIY